MRRRCQFFADRNGYGRFRPAGQGGRAGFILGAQRVPNRGASVQINSILTCFGKHKLLDARHRNTGLFCQLPY